MEREKRKRTGSDPVLPNTKKKVMMTEAEPLEQIECGSCDNMICLYTIYESYDHCGGDAENECEMILCETCFKRCAKCQNPFCEEHLPEGTTWCYECIAGGEDDRNGEESSGDEYKPKESSGESSDGTTDDENANLGNKKVDSENKDPIATNP